MPLCRRGQQLSYAGTLKGAGLIQQVSVIWICRKSKCALSECVRAEIHLSGWLALHYFPLVSLIHATNQLSDHSIFFFFSPSDEFHRSPATTAYIN